MSGFHESIKSLLQEFEKFLFETLKHEKLSKASKSHQKDIIDRIGKIKEEWPALCTSNTVDQVKPTVINKDDESTRTGGSSNTDEGEDPYADSSADIPNVGATELTDFLKAGFLEKKSPSTFRKMQKRWCVIKGNILYYFNDKTSKKMSGAFRLIDYSFEGAPELIKDDKKKELCFKLVRPANRTYEFMAYSKTDFDEWKQIIEKVSCTTSQTGTGLPDQQNDSGEIYEDVGEDVQEPGEIYDDGQEGDISEDEQTSAATEHECDDVYDDGTSAPIEEEEYVDASTPQIQEDPYQGRPPPPKRSLPKKPEEIPTVPKRSLPKEPEEISSVKEDETVVYRNEDDFENMYIGKWDCCADDEKELSFKKGEIIYIINKDFEEKSWWIGELKGHFGLVPKNYLTQAYETMTF